ncbi:DUF1657 domain-containing protein [Cytobacillus sp. FJAT-54145]|uniref:DUF1657 domain-containing protein n=1 Tax=Cytobacillus spartinae TaxID=3299023 RepID=A0ABW6KCR4_9BACI
MTVASNIKQTLSTIKGIEAQLSSLAQNAKEESASITFHETMMTIGEIKKDLQIRLTEVEQEEPEYKGS